MSAEQFGGGSGSSGLSLYHLSPPVTADDASVRYLRLFSDELEILAWRLVPTRRLYSPMEVSISHRVWASLQKGTFAYSALAGYRVGAGKIFNARTLFAAGKRYGRRGGRQVRLVLRISRTCLSFVGARSGLPEYATHDVGKAERYHWSAKFRMGEFPSP